MIDSWYLKKGDIIKWLREYVSSKYYIKTYKYLSNEQKLIQKEEFKKSNIIINEYKVLVCSLEEYEKSLLENYINKQCFENEKSIINNIKIVENWEKVVLDCNIHSLKEINIKSFGLFLKNARKKVRLYRNQAAELLGIDESTLRSYEDGKRIIRVDVIYKMIQLYKNDNIIIYLQKELK